MAASKLTKARWIAGLTAGAAALALAVPAQAQHWRGRSPEGVQPAAERVERNAPTPRADSAPGQPVRGWSRGEAPAPRADRAPGQPAPNWSRPAPSQPPVDNAGWQARQAERAARAQAQEQARPSRSPGAPAWQGRQPDADGNRARWRDRAQWQGRGPAPSDPGRPATVTNRDESRDRDRDRNATNDRRYRDNTWWNGNRDGVRNWRDSQNHPDPRVRERYREAYARDRYRDAYRDGWRDNSRRWNRDWRNDDRYDWYNWRSRNRSIFSVGFYVSPYRNYSYRRLNTGYHLDSLFFSSRYWISDPWRYRLPEVYGPYRWVRYYDDVLLVDIYSGEVVDVIHNFFY